MRFIFDDDWNDAQSWSRFSCLAMSFSSNWGPWFFRKYTRVLKSKYDEEYSTVDNREKIEKKYYSGEILFCGVLRRYVSQNIDSITGTQRLNRSWIIERLDRKLISRWLTSHRRFVGSCFKMVPSQWKFVTKRWRKYGANQSKCRVSLPACCSFSDFLVVL